MSTALTEAEQVKLRDLEGIIERGLQTFVEVGASLTLIREQRLYRTSHPTFDEYCKERWGWSANRSRRLMEASEVVGALAETVPIGTLPENEAQAREVAAAPSEKRAEVWTKAVETAPKATDGSPKVTAKHVRQTAAAVIPISTKKNGSIDKLASLRATREAQARPKPEPSRDEQDRTSRSNAYASVGRLVSFAHVVLSEKNIQHHADLLTERPEEFYADQRYTVEQVIKAGDQVLVGLPDFLAALKERATHV